MPTAFLSRFPDPGAVTQIGVRVQSGARDLADALGTMSKQLSGSPLAAVGDALDGLESRLSIDVRGLTRNYPVALGVMQEAMAPVSVDFVRSIEKAYADAHRVLADSALARKAGAGQPLQRVALAAIERLLKEFEQRSQTLAAKLIDPLALANVIDTYAQMARFKTNFSAHRADFLPFISHNLLGVAPDLLNAPLVHATGWLDVLAVLDPEALEVSLYAPNRTLKGALGSLSTAVAGMDAADPQAYARINVHLDVLDGTVRELRDTAQQIYASLGSAIDARRWDSLFDVHRALLDSVRVSAPLSVEAVIDGLVAVLGGVSVELQAAVGPLDLVERIQALNRSIENALTSSPLGQIRGVIRGFLEQIRDAIESVPTEALDHAVGAMLGRVRQEIDALDPEGIGDNVEAGLREIESFIAREINQALEQQVSATIGGLLGRLQVLPVDTLISGLDQVVVQLEALIGEIEIAVQGACDELIQVVALLDELSFKPTGDAVVAEIDELKERLRRINPNALSKLEKRALEAALAGVRAIERKGLIDKSLKAGFDSVQSHLLNLLHQVSAVLGTLRQRIDGYNPELLLGGVTDALEASVQLLDGLSPRALMVPLYDRCEALESRLDDLSPDVLLDPLQAPFEAVRAAIDELDPGPLVVPLRVLHSQINGVIDRIDVTPVCDELDRRQRELFARTRQAVLAALDELAMPEPLAGFVSAMRPALEGMTDALFQASDTELRCMGVEFSAQFELSTPFESLDRAFDDLLDMLDSVPETELTDAVNALRTAIAVGLDVIDPQHIMDALRRGQNQLASVAPPLLLGLSPSLPSVRASFAVRAAASSATLKVSAAETLARFDAVIALSTEALALLIVSHTALEASLRQRIDALDRSGADAAYARLRAEVSQVLPDFLRSAEPLDRATITAGIEALRPSLRVASADALFDELLAQLHSLQAGIEPAINAFFQTIREALMLISPLSLKDSIAEIYTAIRQRLQILDPDALSERLYTLFDPVVGALDSLDPARLKVRLEDPFLTIRMAITKNVSRVLDEIAAAIDQQLRVLRNAVTAMAERIEVAIKVASDTFDNLVHRIEQLILVDVIAHLENVIETLGVNFDKELDRIRNAFDAMLNAIPLGRGSHASAAVP